MRAITRAAAGAAFAGSLLFTGGMAPAMAAPVDQDGLVNVNVGDITIRDAVDLNVAASLAVTACDLADVTVNQVAVLARAIAVDRSGQSQTICRTDAGDVVLENN